jgi:hypothetical protein
MFEACQCRIALAHNVLTMTGGERTTLMEGTLQDGVLYFQRVQRQVK